MNLLKTAVHKAIVNVVIIHLLAEKTCFDVQRNHCDCGQ